MQPITQRNPNLYRAPRTSEEMNELFNSIHQDISNLYQVANRNNQSIKTNMDNYIIENFFLQKRLEEVENMYFDELRSKRISENKVITTRSMFSERDILMRNRENYANINTKYGYCSPKISDSVTKLSYIDSLGERVFPDGLSVLLYEGEQSYSRYGYKYTDYSEVIPEGIENAFDGKEETVFKKTLELPLNSSTTQIYGKIEITIPREINNNPFSNEVIVDPFPEFGLDILDIEVIGESGDWRRLPTYPTEKINGMEHPVVISGSRRLKFTFPNEEFTKMVISFRQNSYLESNTKKTFTYGFREIDIRSTSYSHNEFEVVTKLSAEELGGQIRRVEYPVVNKAIGSMDITPNMVSHQLFYDKEMSSPFEFNSKIHSDVRELFILTKIKASGERVPRIHSIEIATEIY